MLSEPLFYGALEALRREATALQMVLESDCGAEAGLRIARLALFSLLAAHQSSPLVASKSPPAASWPPLVAQEHLPLSQER